MTETYLDRTAYDQLVEKLIAALIDRINTDGPDALKLMLGEACGIWPVYCRDGNDRL